MLSAAAVGPLLRELGVTDARALAVAPFSPPLSLHVLTAVLDCCDALNERATAISSQLADGLSRVTGTEAAVLAPWHGTTASSRATLVATLTSPPLGVEPAPATGKRKRGGGVPSLFAGEGAEGARDIIAAFAAFQHALDASLARRMRRRVEWEAAEAERKHAAEKAIDTLALGTKLVSHVASVVPFLAVAAPVTVLTATAAVKLIAPRIMNVLSLKTFVLSAIERAEGGAPPLGSVLGGEAAQPPVAGAGSGGAKVMLPPRSGSAMRLSGARVMRGAKTPPAAGVISPGVPLHSGGEIVASSAAPAPADGGVSGGGVKRARHMTMMEQAGAVASFAATWAVQTVHAATHAATPAPASAGGMAAGAEAGAGAGAGADTGAGAGADVSTRVNTGAGTGAECAGGSPIAAAGHLSVPAVDNAAPLLANLLATTVRACYMRAYDLGVLPVGAPGLTRSEGGSSIVAAEEAGAAHDGGDDGSFATAHSEEEAAR